MNYSQGRPAFIQNRGQQPEEVRYFTDLGKDRLLLTTDAAVWTYALPMLGDGGLWAIALRLPGATTIQLVERAPDLISLLRSAKAEQRISRDRWSTLRYVEPWPGIDLTFRVGDGVAWWFDLAPGADVGALELQFEGISGLQLDEEGELILSEGDLRLYHPRPVAVQAESFIPVGYQLLGPKRVGFWLGPHHPALPVQIQIVPGGNPAAEG